MMLCSKPFQSTLPARGATRMRHATPRRAAISIHAPRTGSDTRPGTADDRPRTLFQSTLPARGATAAKGRKRPRKRFQSTLPARGATWTDSTCWATPSDFNPRSPHGERRDPGFYESWDEIFQSTLPARGATPKSSRATRRKEDFNPRSPHGERREVPHSARQNRHFNPRSPHGERRIGS